MEFITQRTWAMVPKLSEGTSKDLRVINFVVPSSVYFREWTMTYRLH